MEGIWGKVKWAVEEGTKGWGEGGVGDLSCSSLGGSGVSLSVESLLGFCNWKEIIMI